MDHQITNEAPSLMFNPFCFSLLVAHILNLDGGCSCDAEWLFCDLFHVSMFSDKYEHSMVVIVWPYASATAVYLAGGVSLLRASL